MKHLILGTAGHVDHGKTSLVKALTGVDTDRLPEEKARGMTIELGFTHLDLPSGIVLGVVDMPGHEKFIKHMAAGAGGVDIALLVIAADEGIMQQTEEHLEILELLGIGKGVVALTKSDLVDGEWIAMVEEEVKERLKGTALAGSPIVAVSSVSGNGLDELRSALDAAAGLALERKSEPASRLYIDRSFVLTGQGTVVTGTLLGGSIKEGDKLELLPSAIQVKVKKVEVHDMPVQIAERGQRVALNLTGAEKSEVERGMVLASPGWLETTGLIDSEVRMLDPQVPIEHNQRLRLHVGTSEVICRARVPRQESQEGIVFIQLELEEDIALARGDRFVLRSYSPASTLAGGKVASTTPPRRKIGSPEEAESIRKLSLESPAMLEEIIRVTARCKGSEAWPMEPGELRRLAYLTETAFDELVERGQSEGSLMRMEWEGSSYLIDARSMGQRAAFLAGALSSYHATHPLRRGMPKEEARQKAFPVLDRKRAAALISGMTAMEVIKSDGDILRLPEHEVRLGEKQASIADSIEGMFKSSLLAPPDLVEVVKAIGREAEPVIDYLADTGRLVKASSEVSFHKDAIDAAIKAASSFEGQFSAAMLRDALGTSRKYAIALIEWMDAEELTQRNGDMRTMRKRSA